MNTEIMESLAAKITTEHEAAQRHAGRAIEHAKRAGELGFKNEDGSEATSAVLHPCGMPEAKPQATGKNQRAALDKLHELEEQRRQNLMTSGHDPSTARVRIDDWREACMKVMKKSGFYAAKGSLEESGQIVIQTGGYVRPN